MVFDLLEDREVRAGRRGAGGLVGVDDEVGRHVLRAGRAVGVAADHLLLDRQHGLGADDAGVVGAAALVGGVAEQLGEADEVAGVDPLGVAVDDALDGRADVRGASPVRAVGLQRLRHLELEVGDAVAERRAERREALAAGVGVERRPGRRSARSRRTCWGPSSSGAARTARCRARRSTKVKNWSNAATRVSALPSFTVIVAMTETWPISCCPPRTSAPGRAPVSSPPRRTTSPLTIVAS